MGVDLSFTATGWIIVDPDGMEYLSCGVVRTKRENKKRKITVTLDDIRRVEIMAFELENTIREYDVGGIVAEFPTGGSQSAISTKGLGIAVGVLVSVCATLKVPLLPVKPSESKKAIGGSTRSSKDWLAMVVLRHYPQIENFMPKGVQEHITDAAAALMTSRDWDVYRRLYFENATRRVLNG